MTSVGLELLQQKGLRERISPICTLSQNGYGNLMCVTLVALAYLQTKHGSKQKQLAMGVTPRFSLTAIPSRMHQISSDL